MATFSSNAPRFIPHSSYDAKCDVCTAQVHAGDPIYWQSKKASLDNRTRTWHQACYEKLTAPVTRNVDPNGEPARMVPATPEPTPQPSQGEPMQNDPTQAQADPSGSGGSGEPKLRDQISGLILSREKIMRHLHKDDLLRAVANLRPFSRIDWVAASGKSKGEIAAHIASTAERFCLVDEAPDQELRDMERRTVLRVDRRLSEILLQKRQDEEAAQQAQEEARKAQEEAAQAKHEAQQAQEQAQNRAKFAEEAAKQAIEKAEAAARVIEVKRPDGERITIEGQHQRFADLLTLVACGTPVLLVGPAGGGKTHAAGLVAENLGIDFTPLSLGPQSTQASVFGYSDATGGYVRTPFREAYERGGLILLDELDRCNERVSVTLNAAIANGRCSFPDGTIEQHAQCYIIAAGNTNGHGADRQYVSARQQDAALLDRFAVLDWQYDLVFESALAAATCEEHAVEWTTLVRNVREQVETLSLRYVVSPRATLQGLTLLKGGATWALAVETVLFRGWNENDKHKVQANVEVTR